MSLISLDQNVLIIFVNIYIYIYIYILVGILEAFDTENYTWRLDIVQKSWKRIMKKNFV